MVKPNPVAENIIAAWPEFQSLPGSLVVAAEAPIKEIREEYGATGIE